MKLVIVESPAKSKTIAKYLGEGYMVDACQGHIRDLPVKTLGVDIKNNYKPEYEVIKDKNKTEIIDRLKDKAKKAEHVILATDPDREGEAISWHLQNILKLKDNYTRIEFNEITKSAITKAINNPRKINFNLVDAQQARRVLDRLVGYKLSPLLNKKIKSSAKLSAGRVQSAALKMIVDKEKIIKAFVSEEYWTLIALLSKASNNFKSTLFEYNKKKLKVTNKEQCDKVLRDLQGASYVVRDVKRSSSQSNPYAPFTTSTMQQDASIKLSMPSSITMQTAQQLYEGVDIKGEGHTALITYIRTDSVRVSDEAIATAREFILKHFGKEYAPAKPNIYKSKKESQDAHEAIRPVSLDLTPAMVKDKLQRNQYRLYKLIYERFLASQAVPAIYDTLTAVIEANNYGFKTSGKVLKFDGYTKIYTSEKEVSNNEADEEDESVGKLPDLNIGDVLKLEKLTSEQKFTKPPTRYSESSLIKALEENGIGRPSTYATIISTLLKRLYVAKEDRYLVPSDLGIVVNDYLVENFNNIVDAPFTANMEDQLDTIEENGAEWTKVIDDFYKPFAKELAIASKDTALVEMPDEVSEYKCEKCGAPMLIKTGRYGKYLACSAYPECKNITKMPAPAPVMTDLICEKCGAPMVERVGRYGKFIACSNYPTCSNTKTTDEVVGVCPTCGGNIVKRRSKKGALFFGCSNYPKCNYMTWTLPTQNATGEISKPIDTSDTNKE